MKKIRKGMYEYKGYIITKDPDYNYWYVELKEKKYSLDYMTQYGDSSLKCCKEWIDSEVNA